MSLHSNKDNKERSSDRLLVIKPVDGKPVDTRGLIDSRLFTGKNALHAKMDPTSCLWSVYYDAGVTPEPLRQKFTSFRILREHVEDYYKKRNIEVTEVKD